MHVAILLGAITPLGEAEASITGGEAKQILEQLQQIRSLLERQVNPQSSPPAPARTARVTIDVGLAPWLGREDAPVTIVEFTDFQCPYCNRFFEDAFVRLKKNYIDLGKVRFYSMDFPLDFHRNASRAAEAGRCAGEQGQFWPMHDRMQANPNRLDVGDLLGYAQESGVYAPQLRQCLESGKYRDAIQQEVLYASNRGVRGTPAFVIGKSSPTGVDGELLIGAQPYGSLDERLKALIDLPHSQ